MINDNYIKKISIDWDKVPSESYLNSIYALKNIQYLNFDNRVTFFTGENGSGDNAIMMTVQ